MKKLLLSLADLVLLAAILGISPADAAFSKAQAVGDYVPCSGEGKTTFINRSDRSPECWQCPAGYTKTLRPGTKHQAFELRCHRIDTKWNTWYSKADRARDLACPSGQFRDPRSGGECWSCPSGYERTWDPVTSATACSKSNPESLESATFKLSTACPSGQFRDPRSGGECWSCPSGYNRTGDAVTSATACVRPAYEVFRSASRGRRTFWPHECPGGTFHDTWAEGFGQPGSCWSCGGWRRTGNHITSGSACVATVGAAHSGAAYHRRAYCTTGEVFDPRNGGECWSCPSGYNRSGNAVYGAAACSKANPVSLSRATYQRIAYCNKTNDTEREGHGACWTCPKTYTWNPGGFAAPDVKDDKACYKTDRPANFKETRAEHVAPVKFLSKYGCLQGGEAGGGKCYKCPAGMGRTVFVEDVTSATACATTFSLPVLAAIQELKKVTTAAANQCEAVMVQAGQTVSQAAGTMEQHFGMSQTAKNAFGAACAIYTTAGFTCAPIRILDRVEGAAALFDNVGKQMQQAPCKDLGGASLGCAVGMAVGGDSVGAFNCLAAAIRGGYLTSSAKNPALCAYTGRASFEFAMDRVLGVAGAQSTNRFLLAMLQSFSVAGKANTAENLSVTLARLKECRSLFPAGLPALPPPDPYDDWVRIQGAGGRDIGVGETVWIIGTATQYGGYTIHQWLGGSSWRHIPGGAVRVDVGRGLDAWVVTSLDTIWRWRTNGQGWLQVPGKGKDIGVAPNGAGVWMIGDADMGAGNYAIYRWDQSKSDWQKMPGTAYRIDVDPNGVPWVVTRQGRVYRWRGSDWGLVSGPSAQDIGIGWDGTVWLVGSERTAGGFKLYKGGANGWTLVPGGAVAVSVDGLGKAYVVNDQGVVYKYK